VESQEQTEWENGKGGEDSKREREVHLIWRARLEEKKMMRSSFVPLKGGKRGHRGQEKRTKNSTKENKTKRTHYQLSGKCIKTASKPDSVMAERRGEKIKETLAEPSQNKGKNEKGTPLKAFPRKEPQMGQRKGLQRGKWRGLAGGPRFTDERKKKLAHQHQNVRGQEGGGVLP